MILVFLGPPGAGKGTQAKMLEDRFGYRQISTGDILRRHRSEKTPLGLEALSYMDAGKLVPDDVIIRMMEVELADHEDAVVDGFPRTIPQAQAFDAFLEGKGVKAVAVVFDVDYAVLTERNLMSRKGFPESYDTRRLLEFVAGLKAGRSTLAVPTYSHLIYDIVPDHRQIIERPDILILEGLNVLQGGQGASTQGHPVFVSDFFDFSIYVDAPEDLLESWFLERFRRLRNTAFKDERSYFRRYAAIPEAEAMATASEIWREVNLKNLRQNVAPTRERANIVLRKGVNHAVDAVWLRKN